MSRARETRSRRMDGGGAAGRWSRPDAGSGGTLTIRSMRSNSGPESRFRYRSRSLGVHRHGRTGWPWRPHGQGFMVASRTNLARRLPCRRARNADAALLEGLLERLQRPTGEFRQFVEKEDAVVRQADLAGARDRAAADEGHMRDGVMRRQKRPVAEQPATGGHQAGDRVDGRRFQGFVERRRGQDARQALGHHRLPGAGRPDEQIVMPARRGNLERPLGQQLAVDVEEIRCQRVSRDRPLSPRGR